MGAISLDFGCTTCCYGISDWNYISTNVHLHLHLCWTFDPCQCPSVIFHLRCHQLLQCLTGSTRQFQYNKENHLSAEVGLEILLLANLLLLREGHMCQTQHPIGEQHFYHLNLLHQLIIIHLQKKITAILFILPSQSSGHKHTLAPKTA
jgi:hypothetical protein